MDYRDRAWEWETEREISTWNPHNCLSSSEFNPYLYRAEVGWCAFGHGVADAHADSHPRWAPFYACRVPGVFWLSQKILRSMVNYPNQLRSRKSLLWWYSGALRTTVLMSIVWYLYLWSHYFDIFNFHLIYLYISSKFIFIQRHRIHLTFLIIEIINLVSIKSISYPFPYHL